MRGSSNGLTLNVKVSLFGSGTVLIAVAALVLLAMWQSSRYNNLAQSEVDGLIEADLDHITLGIYNLVRTENEAVQQQVDADLGFAQHLLTGAGGVSQAAESVAWTAVNQLSGERMAVQLPKMLLGGRWLGKNQDPAVETPVVDEMTRLAGDSATVFQRMNSRGDMLRVATTIMTTEGLRAVGTYIPAVNPDGTANSVIESVLRGETYSGRAYVVNAYYLTAYRSIRNAKGAIVGMLYVGVKLANVEARVRQAILRTPVGKTGYVYVLGGTGEERGRYIISQRGERDGEDIWATTDSDGLKVIQEIIRKAVSLRPGELATKRYRWQNPGESAPRSKVVRLAYFEPWDWVIGASVYEDELQGYRAILNDGRRRMTAIMGAAGFVITALMALLVAFLTWTIVVRPVRRLTDAAETIIGGNLEGTVDVRSRDEIGVLARTFNVMTERLKRTMESLSRSEEKYRGIFENAIEGFFQSSLDGRFLTVNPAMAGILGYASPADLTERMTDIRRQLYVYPEDRDEIITALLEGWTIVRREVQFHRKDGGTIWVSLNDHLIRDANGNPHHIEGFIYDITERKRGDSELALERSLLKALMENIPDHIYFKDAESRFIRSSRAQARMFDLRDASEVIGKTDKDFYSEKHAVKAYEDEQRIIHTGEPIVNVEERETWPNRPDTWALTTKMPLRDHEGNIIGTFGISHDITERKRAEEHILSLARFTDENPHPVLRVAPDGLVIYSNKASEPLISSWATGADRKVPAEYRRALTLAWESGEKQEIEIREASRSYAVTIVPFAAAGYVNIYGRDVTEEKTLAERLNQAQKMQAIGQLTGGVAHDFNNILQAITGYCELLRTGSSEENQKSVEEIAKAAWRAATLTTQLLAFSRKQILKPRVVNTRDLIHSMNRLLERVIGEDVELTTCIDPATGNFLADPGQMEQVLLNLAVNARDAMPSGGKLTIETSNRTFDEAYVHDHPGAKVGQYVRIAVSDTGIGMDQETLSHIYEPFFTTKEKEKGTGLGLSTVYGIVEQSEGYINCYSEKNSGTTFTIYLPLTLEEADKPLVSVSSTIAPRGTETVLLVDDDEAVRRVARIALEEAGYLVIEAACGEDALAEAGAKNPRVALLVTDVVMPHMSGKELARSLGTICPGVKILYVSGYTANMISHHGILEGGMDFLQKPFSSRELLAKVREILDRP